MQIQYGTLTGLQMAQYQNHNVIMHYLVNEGLNYLTRFCHESLANRSVMFGESTFGQV